MAERKVRKCIKCGGFRVYMGEGAEVQTLPDGRRGRASDFTCLDCGARLFSYQWLVDPDAYTGPSYRDREVDGGDHHDR